MDRFGPNGKVSKKQVHLLRWSSFPGRTGLNFGWMDRAHRLIEIEIETGLLYLIFLISFIACRTCSPCIARISRSHSASQCWREKCKKGRETGVFYCSWGKSCEQEKKQRGGLVSLQCRRFLRARKCFCSWELHDGGYTYEQNTNKVSPTHRCFSRSLTLCRTPLSERLERAMSTRTKRTGSA